MFYGCQAASRPLSGTCPGVQIRGHAQVPTCPSSCLPGPRLWPGNSPQGASLPTPGGQGASSGQWASLRHCCALGAGGGAGPTLGAWMGAEELNLASPGQCGFDRWRPRKGEWVEDHIPEKTNSPSCLGRENRIFSFFFLPHPWDMGVSWPLLQPRQGGFLPSSRWFLMSQPFSAAYAPARWSCCRAWSR